MDIEIDYGYLAQAQVRAAEIASEVRTNAGLPDGDASACGAPQLTSTVSRMLGAVASVTSSSSSYAAMVGTNLGMSIRDYRATDENESSNLSNARSVLPARRAVD